MNSGDRTSAGEVLLWTAASPTPPWPFSPPPAPPDAPLMYYIVLHTQLEEEQTDRYTYIPVDRRCRNPPPGTRRGVPENLVSRDGFSRPVPRQPAHHLHTQAVCVFFPFILDIKFVGRTSRGHTGFLIHLLSAVRALIFLARRIQPFLSLVDPDVEFRVLITI